MSIGNTVKGIGQYLGGGLIMLALIALPICFLFGMTAISLWMLQWNGIIFDWALVGVLSFSIISIIPSMRKISAVGLIITSMALGAVAWFTGVSYTYITWGFIALVIGLLIGGFGVIPIAMLAAIIHGHWYVLMNLIFIMALSLGCRIFGMWLAIKEDERAARKYYIEAEAFE